MDKADKAVQCPSPCPSPLSFKSDEATIPPTPDSVRRDFAEVFDKGRSLVSVMKDKKTKSGRWVKSQDGTARRL
jgi:hypothetical protein